MTTISKTTGRIVQFTVNIPFMNSLGRRQALVRNWRHISKVSPKLSGRASCPFNIPWYLVFVNIKKDSLTIAKIKMF